MHSLSLFRGHLESRLADETLDSLRGLRVSIATNAYEAI